MKNKIFSITVFEFHIYILNDISKIERRVLLIDLTSYFLDRKHRLTTAPLTKKFFFNTWEASVLF